MGDHYLLNLYECDPRRLNDENFIRNTLEEAAEFANMTLINIMSYKFTPQGVTAIALLAESHMSIHTWPEECKAAVDVYTCGDKAKPQVACSTIKSYFISKQSTIDHVVRV